MKDLNLGKNQVEFQATKTDEFGQTSTYRIKLEIGWQGNEARLSVDSENYTFTLLRKGAKSELNSLREDLHFLQGQVDSTYNLLTTITNCGVNPPEFWIILENTTQEIVEAVVYNIDHNIQSDINGLISRSQARLLPLPKKYFDLVNQLA